MSNRNERTILLVEDTRPSARIYEECLRQEGYAVVTEELGQNALSFLEWFLPTAVVLDLMLPDINGMEVLKRARDLHPNLPIVVITANNSVHVAVEAMQKGAFDFIVKPFRAERLTATLRNAIERRVLVDELTQLRQALGQNRYFDFVGQSPAMQAVYRVIDSVASSRASIFIRGESGTGKELAARAIHKASPRRDKPFVTLNCDSIPKARLESDIFGHMKHASDGNPVHVTGALNAAHGGTLYLNEVCELPPSLQGKLLRYLQTGEFTPIGSDKASVTDVRIISSASVDLLREIQAKRFREDLYYRLHVVPIEMPALHDREDDVILLAHHFLAKFSAEENKNFTSLEPEVASLFRHYDWPGNVRQLENVIRNVVVLNNDYVIRLSMLPEKLQHFSDKNLLAANQNANDIILVDRPDQDNIQPLWMVEKTAIMRALELTQEDIIQAAALLEISPPTLCRKLRDWRNTDMTEQKTKIGN